MSPDSTAAALANIGFKVRGVSKLVGPKILGLREFPNLGGPQNGPPDTTIPSMFP